MNHTYTVAVMVVIALITLATRAFPFIVLGSKREVSERVLYIGRVLPPPS